MLHQQLFFCALLINYCVAALQSPLLPFTDHAPHTFKRVAIIGAGSAGTSTAYYLRNFTSSHPASIPLNITIFERSSYIGGRSTTVAAYDDPRQPVELGASIFVSANRNLVAAVEAFDLSVGGFGISSSSDDGDDDDDYEASLGIWNGEAFLVTQTLSSGRLAGWWSTAKILWRYGLSSPLRARHLTATIVTRFLRLYDAPVFPFRSLTAAAQLVELSPDVTGSLGAEYLVQEGISAQFANEVVQASTRVNYAQNLDQIHALETMVCLATDGAMSVAGGNWRIFDGMARHSGAEIRLSEEIQGVERLAGGGYRVTSKSVLEGDAAENSNSKSNSNSNSDNILEGEYFDAVVLAAPYHAANLAINPPLPLASTPYNTTYVTLHVTLLTTPHLLSPSFFNLPTSSPVPNIVLTTLPSPSSSRAQNQTKSPQVGPPGFWSISTLRSTRNPHIHAREFLYKIFSPEPVDADLLTRLFDLPQSATPAAATKAGAKVDATQEGKVDDHELPEGVSWMYRKSWLSYPYLPPRTEFDALCLDCEIDGESGNMRAGGGFYYTSAIEPFISTMETSSLSGMNVARLLVDDWIAEAQSTPQPMDDRARNSGVLGQNALMRDW